MNRTAIGFVLSVLLLAALVVLLGPDRLAARLVRVNLPVFALGFLATLLSLVCWSEATRRPFVDAGATLSPWKSFLTHNVAMFGKQVLPMGALGGPVVMAYAFERATSMGYNRSLAVMTVVEFLGVAASVSLGLLSLGWLLLFAPPLPAVGSVRLAVITFAVVAAGAAGAFWYLRTAVERVFLSVTRLLRASVGRLSGRLYRTLDPGRAGTGLARYYRTMDAVVDDRRLVVAVFGFNFLGWVFASLSLYTSALALGVELSVVLALFLIPASGVVTVIPLPGGLGGVEVALVGVLAAFGDLPLALAAAVVVLYRLCSYWFILLLGAVTSAYSAVSFADLGIGENQ